MPSSPLPQGPPTSARKSTPGSDRLLGQLSSGTGGRCPVALTAGLQSHQIVSEIDDRPQEQKFTGRLEDLFRSMITFLPNGGDVGLKAGSTADHPSESTSSSRTMWGSGEDAPKGRPQASRGIAECQEQLRCLLLLSWRQKAQAGGRLFV